MSSISQESMVVKGGKLPTRLNMGYKSGVMGTFHRCFPRPQFSTVKD